MKIGWIIHTVGAFGSVREVVEVSNVLIKRGHQVTIYHPDGGQVKWLPTVVECKSLPHLEGDRLDVAIGVIGWESGLFEVVQAANARLRAISFLGFEPSEEMAAVLRGDQETKRTDLKIMRQAVRDNYMLLTDSSWQVDWLTRYGKVNAGPSFGGINLQMFHPLKARTRRNTIWVGASGDPRPRKGSDTVNIAVEALKGVPFEFKTYWGKRFTQDQLVHFYGDMDIFVDGHRRGGWCNPVAEAMACGTAVVCTRNRAVEDFALHEETALVTEIDEPYEMSRAIQRLIEDGQLRATLAKNARKRIQIFSYEKVVPNLEKAFLERLS